MRLTHSLRTALGAAALLASLGCAAHGPHHHAARGAAFGTATGAAFGAAIDREEPWRGAFLGGALGALAGGAIGDSIDRREAEYGVHADHPGYADRDRARDATDTIIVFPSDKLFEAGSARLRPEGRERLERFARRLRGERRSEITIGVHTDAFGSERGNLALSRDRADRVRHVLVREGIPARRIRAEGFGESRPVASNRSASGRRDNRRVEIEVHPIGRHARR